MKTNPPPKDNFDGLQFFVRFGCGALFAIIIVFSWGFASWGEFILLALILGSIFGLLAAKYGDRFWKFLSGP